MDNCSDVWTFCLTPIIKLEATTDFNARLHFIEFRR
jgi:hypothetical protein